MDIRICGYIAASDLLARESGEWHALVVLDSNAHPTDFVACHAKSHLYLRFDDIEAPRDNLVCPNERHVVEALQFAAGKERLIVTCRAGQSRSAALAYLHTCQHAGPAQAVDLLNPTRHIPNRKVVMLGGIYLNTPVIWQQFEDWRQKNAHIRLSDHYDEIEHEIELLEVRGAKNRICTP
jgi:predicted protein tyrosine phosphatase